MTISVTIIGLGYVGLPLVQEACRSGMQVSGFDTDSTVVTRLNGGESHIDDVDMADLAEMLKAGFAATDDPACVGASD